MTLINLNFQSMSFAAASAGKDCANSIVEFAMNFDINYGLTVAIHRNHFERKCPNIICGRNGNFLFIFERKKENKRDEFGS